MKRVSHPAPAAGGSIAPSSRGRRGVPAGAAILLMLMLLSRLVPGAAFAAQPDPTRGKEKYQQLCAACHGPSGKGDGPAAAALNPKPRDYTDKKFSMSDQAMHDVIKRGGAAVGKSPVMPAWGQALSDQDIRDVIAYIRALARK